MEKKIEIKASDFGLEEYEGKESSKKQIGWVCYETYGIGIFNSPLKVKHD